MNRSYLVKGQLPLLHKQERNKEQRFESIEGFKKTEGEVEWYLVDDDNDENHEEEKGTDPNKQHRLVAPSAAGSLS